VQAAPMLSSPLQLLFSVKFPLIEILEIDKDLLPTSASCALIGRLVWPTFVGAKFIDVGDKATVGALRYAETLIFPEIELPNTMAMSSTPS
jgi:hypothetical protein